MGSTLNIPFNRMGSPGGGAACAIRRLGWARRTWATLLVLFLGSMVLVLGSIELNWLGTRRCSCSVQAQHGAAGASHGSQADHLALGLGIHLPLPSARPPVRTTAEPLGYSAPVGNGTGIPGFKVLHRVSGDPEVPLGWWALEMEYTYPTPDAKYLLEPSYPCFEIAKHHDAQSRMQRVRQPWSHIYQRRQTPPTALPGNVPRAFWRWEASGISREQFDMVPEDIRGQCNHCTAAIRYQVIAGHLFRKNGAYLGGREDMVNLHYMEDMLLTALHMWDLPDMDFILHNGDGCPPNGWPMLAWNICRDRPLGGFSVPYFTFWREALGPSQQQAFHQCIMSRYKHASRRPVVFWRGSPTNPAFVKLNESNVHNVQRVRVHKTFQYDPVFDTKIDHILDADPIARAYLMPLGSRATEMEEYAQVAIAMDIDGQGVSGRFGHRYLHYGTPVLKQKSNMTSFFEHLTAPGHMLEVYAHNLSDLKARGYQLVYEWTTSPDRLIKQAEQLQGFATALMHQMAVAEAAAYALLMYSKKLTWKTVRNPAYVPVPFSQVCGNATGIRSNQLPPELCAEMHARSVQPWQTT